MSQDRDIPGIYLSYDNHFHIPGIYLVYPCSMPFQVKVICLGYTKDIFSESALSKPGIYLVYTRVMTAHFNSCNPSCSKIAIGMQQHTCFGLQGCLMFITARGVPTGHPSARAWTRAPGTACPCSETLRLRRPGRCPRRRPGRGQRQQ